MKVYVIAEAGVNHNGNLENAFRLVDVASDANADAIKFQTYIADNFVTATAEKAKYQTELTDKTETQYQMLKRLELSQDQFVQLAKYSKSKKIDFLSTAFDHESLKFLHEKLNLKTLKISSGDLDNAPLLLEHARTGCNLIISTGMADIKEITKALSVVAYGFMTAHGARSPQLKEFDAAFSSEKGQHLLNKKVTLLHCTSEYPAPLESINLNFIAELKKIYGLRIGYSDHTKGISVPIAATALGATIIEKHFTLDRSMRGPDHSASLEPNELREMVLGVRAAEKALGTHAKTITSTELANKLIVRKSIVALKVINKNDIFTKDNIGIKRPGTGLSPYKYWEIIGQKASKNFNKGDTIE